jgi:hypothetical protein
LSGKWIDVLCTSKASFVNDPKSAILLPRKVAQEVVFRIHVVAECTSTEECVYKTAVRELAKYLTESHLAKVIKVVV